MHISIQEPISCRKRILETTIEVIRDLKKYEKLAQIRKEKLIYHGHLRKNIRELKTAMAQLDYLPKVKVQERKEKTPKKQETSKPKKHKAPAKPKKVVNKLDQDIEALKARIRSL